MHDNVLIRKKSNIVRMLAQTLNVPIEQAIDLFYSTRTAQWLCEKKYAMHLMSDLYILQDILNELGHTESNT